ncbi:RNA methyltransferase [Cephaloticoccus capnophilus]|uniref:RNA methyltransferase n=2 Tax=Cephaloticoccus capnophilus TaxID=1548208 RepID=A0A139SPM1_9BACT|nr:RNA methyltransferase [Cephaloticoccus capnophilus]
MREAHGLFVVEGEKVVSELLAANFALEALYVTPAWTGPRNHPQFHELNPAEMARVSHFPTPSSALAVGRIHRPPLPEAALHSGLSLVLDRIQDPGNVGTLLRLADWYGLARVILSPDCADLFSQKVINASKGSFARVLCYTTPLAPLLATTRQAAPTVPILGCDLEGDNVHTTQPLHDGVIIIGSEGRGLSPELRPHLTGVITIPRYGAAESLNAALAAAIICDRLALPPK